MNKTLRLGFKKLIALAVTVVLCILVFGATSNPLAVANSSMGKNVALATAGATVSASGSEVPDKWLPEKVIDGDEAGESRWSSDYSDTAWITVKLAQATAIDHVTIKWEQSCAGRYHLEVSNNGTEWTKATAEVTPTCGSIDTQKFNDDVVGKKWQYVKMQAQDRVLISNQKWGVSMYEFEVWDGPAPIPNENLALVPLPQEVVDNSAKEQPFVLTKDSRLAASGAALPVAKLFAGELRTSTGFALPIVESGAKVTDIIFKSGKIDGYNSPEAYALKTGSSGAIITASTAHGFFNATRTLRQLFPAAAFSSKPVNAIFAASAVKIKDQPRFEHRSIQIDPSRSFLTVTEVKRIINQLADLKMSRLHLHVADDQGWRIEITNEGRVAGDSIDYTKLTEISGKTAMNTHEKSKSRELGRTGFYTQAQFKEIVAYAQERHITLIPEIDLPGHTNAALHAIPQLNTAGSSHLRTTTEPTAPANGTGAVGYSYLDPNSEDTYKFMRHVLKQVAALTPGKYVHIGGDEPHAFHQRYGTEVFNQTLGKILQIVRDTGKTPIGWSEIASSPLKVGEGIQYWINYEKEISKTVKTSGAKVVMSLGRVSYIDQKYNRSTPLGLNWACSGICDVRQYYSWDPAKVIPGVGDEQLLGNEAVLWSETVRGGDQAEFMLWSRGAAHAEIGWTAQNKRNVGDFLTRLGAQGLRWTAAGHNFYDTNQVKWDYTLLGGHGLSAPSGTEVTFPLGSLIAPGTKAKDNVVSPDTVQDADGDSASKIPPNTKVSVNWGDGTTATAARNAGGNADTATLVNDLPRSDYNAPSLYRILGKHKYVKDGTYTVTLKAGKRQVSTTVVVKAGAAKPKLPQGWDDRAKAAVTVEPKEFSPMDRIKIEISGFKPNVLADITIGEVAVGQLRPNENGKRPGQYIFVPKSVLNGKQKITVKQGERVATFNVEVKNGFIPLANPLPTGQLQIREVDSEETTGEEAPNGPAKAAIDGNPATFWHTKWANGEDPFPHHITLALPGGKSCKVTGFEYTARAGNVNSRAKEYKFLVSSDGEKWVEVSKGSFANIDDPQPINLPADRQQVAKFVKLEQLSSQSGNNFGGAGEIRVGAICTSGASSGGTEGADKAKGASNPDSGEKGSKTPVNAAGSVSQGMLAKTGLNKMIVVVAVAMALGVGGALFLVGIRRNK